MSISHAGVCCPKTAVQLVEKSEKSPADAAALPGWTAQDQEAPPREDRLRSFQMTVSRTAGLASLALLLALAPALGQGAPPWLDPALLAAAKAEGTLTVYSSTNEQEGLPLFKIFTDATGIKVEYVRGSDSQLTARMMIEFRADQKSYDIVHMTTVNKLPPQMLAQVDPPEAKNISASARDPSRRWYGVYANYNAPAYNTNRVKASELPKSYEELATRKEWAGKVAIDGTDSEWLRALTIHYGEQ
jgi:iron(III) transport system substrate-binding protein